MHYASCCKQAETALFLALEVRRLSSPVRRREAAAKGLIRLGVDTERPVCGINASAKHLLCCCCMPCSSMLFSLPDETVARPHSSMSVEADHVGDGLTTQVWTQVNNHRLTIDAADVLHHGGLSTRLASMGMRHMCHHGIRVSRSKAFRAFCRASEGQAEMTYSRHLLCRQRAIRHRAGASSTISQLFDAEVGSVCFLVCLFGRSKCSSFETVVFHPELMLSVGIIIATALSKLSCAGIESVITETPDCIIFLLWTLQRWGLARSRLRASALLLLRL